HRPGGANHLANRRWQAAWRWRQTSGHRNVWGNVAAKDYRSTLAGDGAQQWPVPASSARRESTDQRIDYWHRIQRQIQHGRSEERRAIRQLLPESIVGNRVRLDWNSGSSCAAYGSFAARDLHGADLSRMQGDRLGPHCRSASTEHWHSADARGKSKTARLPSGRCRGIPERTAPGG